MELGRHMCLRSTRRKVWGFKSPLSHLVLLERWVALTVSKILLANSPVLVVRLGDGKEYLGRIRGLGTTGCYIVECNYSLATYGYPCFSVPEGCLQELTEAQYSEIAHSNGCVQFKPDLS